MGYVERRYGNYRVRYRDPSGRLTSRTFAVTLDRYGHLLPELDEAIATAFGEQLIHRH